MSKKLTVVMPVWNAERFLPLAISSILAQQDVEFTLLLADDCSSDASVSVLQGYAQGDRRVKLLRPFNEHVGPVILRQWLYDQVDTEFVANQDADDYSLPGRLTKQLSVISTDSNLIAVGSACKNINEEGDNFIYPWEQEVVNTIAFSGGDVGSHLQFGHCINFGSTILKTAAVRIAGGLDQSYFPLEDWELFLRLSKFGRITMAREILYVRRVHSKQTSRVAANRDGTIQRIVQNYGLSNYVYRNYRKQGNVPNHPDI